ncbi:uncharacterized protein LOC143363840 [Halictus rubicundus]|uniref:uncharacterized protein LOC143363840 n=1 Tax=Halictus rubicundus TaxID=77578 RepID=UPI0040350005
MARQLEGEHDRAQAQADRLAINAQLSHSQQFSGLGAGNSNADSPLTVHSETHTQVKLPTMQLPEFSGSCDGWPSFSDAFRAAVHDDVKLRGVQKLVYLKSCVKGQAAGLIESLETTEANYSVAWDILEKTYNDPRIIINNRIQAFFELQACTRNVNKSLTDLTHLVTKHYNALKALKKPFLESFPIYAITSKLDDQTRLKWREHTQDTEIPSMDDLLQFLHSRCKILEPAKNEPIKATSQSFTNPNIRIRKLSNSNVHALTLSVQKGRCALCKGNHYIQYCQKFLSTTVERRIEIVQKAGLCINCLRPNHDVTKCTFGTSGTVPGENSNQATHCHVTRISLNDNISRFWELEEIPQRPVLSIDERTCPTIQEELYALLIKFRTYTYVITADIEKMYRQIEVSSDHRIYQKILWRETPDNPIETYALNTVTYGTSAAPFLAIRTLFQLAADEGENLPRAARVLREDFYVDDMLTGADTFEEAVATINEIQLLCAKGGFKLPALRRFFSRRGRASDIYSDNATNFVGANKEIRELYSFLSDKTNNQAIVESLANQSITWHFIPPRSPHFGGIWEAAVKSLKHHLVRVMGEALLSFEGLLTLTAQIEAVLNSRPLTPISSDPNDLTAITPGHFLIGESLINMPDHDYAQVPDGRLSSWQHIQKIKAHFWKRWKTEYLQELTVRRKWHSGGTFHLPIGSMVILQEDNTPPMKWPLGRVTAIHPGEDGIIRVVTVKTSRGEYKRSVKRLSPLPVDM